MRKGELLERFIATGKKNTTLENILICFAAALAGTYYYYERSKDFLIYFPYIITVLIFAVWMGCALVSGKDRKLGFLIFAYAYWLLPYIYTLYYASRNNVKNYSKVLTMIDEIAEALLKNPFALAAEKLRLDTVAMAALLMMCVMICYTAGYFLAFYYEKSLGKKRDDGPEDEEDEYEEY